MKDLTEMTDEELKNAPSTQAKWDETVRRYSDELLARALKAVYSGLMPNVAACSEASRRLLRRSRIHGYKVGRSYRLLTIWTFESGGQLLSTRKIKPDADLTLAERFSLFERELAELGINLRDHVPQVKVTNT